MLRSLFKGITTSNSFWYGLFIALLLPALLINLGLHHIFVHTDESRRALVALEMILSDQWIAPTLNGEWYYNKPPLYNWIIALSFKALGSYSEFAVRLPVVVAIVAFGVSIYLLVKPAMGRNFAMLVVIATITTGRILFYDSFLGLIDIAFSVLVFVNFMLFYYLGRNGPSLKLYAWSYALMAAAYLMKGLPPVVFQFFTLLAWAAYHRNLRFLFHRTHFAGVLFFVLPVGFYYHAYLQVNPQSPEVIFGTIFSESSKRTVTEYGIGDTLLNLVLFPLENMYHFAPWTLLVLGLFSKGVWRKLWMNDFIRYCMVVFAFNIVVYWTAPGVHPRYLFMFLPLFFAVLFHALELCKPRTERRLQIAMAVAIGMAAAIPLWAVWFTDMSAIEQPMAKAIAITLAMLTVFALYLKHTQIRWAALGVFLLLLRIGFDMLMLPNRDRRGAEFARAAKQVVEIADGQPLYILNPSYCHDGVSFMVSRERGEILRIVSEPVEGAFLIIFDGAYDAAKYEPYLEFETRGTDRTLYLAKLRE